MAVYLPVLYPPDNIFLRCKPVGRAALATNHAIARFKSARHALIVTMRTVCVLSRLGQFARASGEFPVLTFMLNLAGAVALLLWSVRLMHTGIERAFAVALRRMLRRSTDSLPVAAAVGAVMAFVMQGSTSVGLLASGFAAAGTLAAASGLAVMLGADLGSALATQVLLFRLDWLPPLLLVVGTVLFLKGRGQSTRQIGRILIGLALVFVSLAMLRATTEPLRDNGAIQAATAYFSGDLRSAFVIGAIAAWAMHSSVATVLLVVTLCAQQVLPTGPAVALVLGANLGGSVVPVVLTMNGPIIARRMTLGNLALRGGGAVAALAVYMFWRPSLELLGSSEVQQVALLHVVFNVAVAAVSLPFAPLVMRQLARLMPAPVDPAALLRRASALDPRSLKEPERALACVMREILRMGESIEEMLKPVMGLYKQWSEPAASALRLHEEDVNRMHFETKLFLARLSREVEDEDVLRRSVELTGVVVALEAAGDVIAKNLLEMAERMRSDGLEFSAEGWSELCDLHDRVLANVQLALHVMMTRDHDSARQLVAEKEVVRRVEREMQAKHLDRLRQGKVASIETSNIHQETTRALKEINSAFSQIAYPMLARAGELLDSRLANRAG